MRNAEMEEVLSQFDLIDLTEMDGVQLMNRVDTKFVFDSDVLTEILPVLQGHFKVLNVGESMISGYESLYYDDPELRFYNDHHRKRLNRVKVRYRTYLESGISFLEVKHKHKGRTNKMRIPSNENHMELPTDHQAFLDSVMPFDTDPLNPSLMNQYQRITLVGKDQDERLTIDLALRFEWKDRKEDMGKLVIAELKQGRINRESPFFRIMKQRGIRPLRLSKYCIGMLKIHGAGALKHNRFKKKLLHIEKLENDAA